MYLHPSIPTPNAHKKQYKAFSISAASWPPRYTKAEFVFEGGVHLAYCDPRRWGRITVRAFFACVSWVTMGQRCGPC